MNRETIFCRQFGRLRYTRVRILNCENHLYTLLSDYSTIEIRDRECITEASSQWRHRKISTKITLV
jgi:hypothetical protein